MDLSVRGRIGTQSNHTKCDLIDDLERNHVVPVTNTNGFGSTDEPERLKEFGYVSGFE